MEYIKNAQYLQVLNGEDAFVYHFETNGDMVKLVEEGLTLKQKVDSIRIYEPTSTLGTTTQVSALVPNFKLLDGALIRLKLTLNIDDGALLNVANTGSYPIVDKNGASVLKGVLNAGDILLFIFNADKKKWYCTQSNYKIFSPATTIGTGEKLTVNIPGFTFVNGNTIRLRLHEDLIPNATLDINALGEKPILLASGRPIKGKFVKDAYITLIYSNGNFILQGEGGGESSGYGNDLNQISSFELLNFGAFDYKYDRDFRGKGIGGK